MKLASKLLAGTLLAWFLGFPFALLGFAGLEVAYDNDLVALYGFMSMTGLPLALSTWAVMVGGSPHWRLTGVIAVLTVGCCIAVCVDLGRFSWLQPVSYALLVATFIQGISLLAVRAVGFRLEITEPVWESYAEIEAARRSRLAQKPEELSANPPVQFSVGDVMSWTASLAVVLSLARTLLFITKETPVAKAFLSLERSENVCIVAGCLVGPMLLWTLLSTRPQWERWGVLAIGVTLTSLPFLAVIRILV